jgi:hypothetical protein
MAQSRRGSMLESVINVLIGYGVAVGAQLLIFPLFGVHLPLGDNMLIAVLFTVVSLVRSYCIRRVMNRFHT